MFEIKNDNGRFVHLNKKLYRGAVELQIDGAYFDIDAKEHEFIVEGNLVFKIISKSDAHIKKSRELQIETPVFDLQEDALRCIGAYLPSLRKYLLKQKISYTIPLKPRIVEVRDSRCCVGSIDVEIYEGARLHIQERERFHNENGAWYRLFGQEGLSICESSTLTIETDAHEKSDDAMWAMEMMLPQITSFLKDNSIELFTLSECIVYINNAATCEEKIYGKVSISKNVPFDMDLIKSTQIDEILDNVLMLIEHKGFKDLPNLYTILEWIRSNMGVNQHKADENIELVGLSTKDDIKRFTNSCNNDKIVGLEHSRHGAKKLDSNNTNIFSYEECVEMMSKLIFNWFDYKEKLIIHDKKRKE